MGQVFSRRTERSGVTRHHARLSLQMALALGMALAATGICAQSSATETASAQSADDVTLDAVSVTGTRIKRANIEGALPVVVFDRAQIEASGHTSVADFLRNTSFNSFGSYQSTSGDAGLGATFIDLRGLGQGRTLILVNGRRAPTSPQVGQGNDLNTIPLAAVERIEILSDGASAMYGSDAIAGVINIITRKDFSGTQVSFGQGFPHRDGGDTREGSLLFGISGERGHLFAGMSHNQREIIFTRARDFWANPPAASTYSNNFYIADVDPDNAVFGWSPLFRLRHPLHGSVVPGGCEGSHFRTVGSGAGKGCAFDTKQQSAKLAKTATHAVFTRGEYAFNSDWKGHFNASISRADGRGRLPSALSNPWPGGDVFIPVDSPNHPGNPRGHNRGNTDGYDHDTPYFLRHRFVASGARDDTTETLTQDLLVGVEGRAGKFDVDVAVRHSASRFRFVGRGYIIGELAQRAISDGSYNIYSPLSNSSAVVNSFTKSIRRKARSTNNEIFASAGFDSLSLPGGIIKTVVGAEYREEKYTDNYDDVSLSGKIIGISGTPAAGSRQSSAVYFETLLPLSRALELNLAGRYDDYSDYGNDVSPKASLRWHPLERWTFRASWGEGFRAPPLSLLSRQTQFESVPVFHDPTCELQGIPAPCVTEVATWEISNPHLQSEHSEQFGLGAVWDAAHWLSMSLDYYNIKVFNQITSVGLMTMYECINGIGSLCPDGLNVFPVNTTIPDPALGLGVIMDPATGGIIGGQAGNTNIDQVQTEGYDFSLHTTFNVHWGTLRHSLQAGYVSEYRSNHGQSIVGLPGIPRIRGNLSSSWSKGSFSAHWNVNYIGGTQSKAWREVVIYDQFAIPVPEEILALPMRLPSWITHDVQLTWQAPWQAQLTLGVFNLSNREAVIDPYDGDDFDSALYNTWGRIPYFRYTQSF